MAAGGCLPGGRVWVSPGCLSLPRRGAPPLHLPGGHQRLLSPAFLVLAALRSPVGEALLPLHLSACGESGGDSLHPFGMFPVSSAPFPFSSCFASRCILTPGFRPLLSALTLWQVPRLTLLVTRRETGSEQEGTGPRHGENRLPSLLPLRRLALPDLVPPWHLHPGSPAPPAAFCKQVRSLRTLFKPPGASLGTAPGAESRLLSSSCSPDSQHSPPPPPWLLPNLSQARGTSSRGSLTPACHLLSWPLSPSTDSITYLHLWVSLLWMLPWWLRW